MVPAAGPPSTLSAPVPAGPEAGQPAPAAVAPVPGSGQKRPWRFPWMWLSALVVLILGCMVTFGALRAFRRSGGLAPPAGAATPLATQVKDTRLGSAAQFATQNPGKPEAYLQLALAYAQDGKDEQVQAMVSALEGQGSAEEAFLWEAARQLADQGSWLAAARLAVDAAELHAGARIPAELITLLHETVYKASKDKQAGRYLDPGRLTPIDEPLARLAKARFIFFNQDRAEGQRLLDELMQFKPGLAEAALCQAEFSAEGGDAERARRSLNQLRQSPDLPDWIVAEANFIEGTLP